LGAGRARLVQHMLAESLVLSAAGGILGLLVAYAALPLVLHLIPVTLPFWMKIEIDGEVLAFDLVVSLLTGVIFGVVPALELSRLDPGVPGPNGWVAVRTARRRGAQRHPDTDLARPLIRGRYIDGHDSAGAPK